VPVVPPQSDGTRGGFRSILVASAGAVLKLVSARLPSPLCYALSLRKAVAARYRIVVLSKPQGF
jgi:hypothetical protein